MSHKGHYEPRRRARRRALQAIYQWQMTGQDVSDIDNQFLTEQIAGDELAVGDAGEVLGQVDLVAGLGDVTCVPVMLEVAVDANDEVAAKAIATLAKLDDERVDDALADRLADAVGRRLDALVDESGEPRLLDFGISKLLAPLEGQPGGEDTRTDDRLFTPHYASPEQLAGRSLTTAAGPSKVSRSPARSCDNPRWPRI